MIILNKCNSVILFFTLDAYELLAI